MGRAGAERSGTERASARASVDLGEGTTSRRSTPVRHLPRSSSAAGRSRLRRTRLRTSPRKRRTRRSERRPPSRAAGSPRLRNITRRTRRAPSGSSRPPRTPDRFRSDRVRRARPLGPCRHPLHRRRRRFHPRPGSQRRWLRRHRRRRQPWSCRHRSRRRQPRWPRRWILGPCSGPPTSTRTPPPSPRIRRRAPRSHRRTSHRGPQHTRVPGRGGGGRGNGYRWSPVDKVASASAVRCRRCFCVRLCSHGASRTAGDGSECSDRARQGGTTAGLEAPAHGNARALPVEESADAKIADVARMRSPLRGRAR